MSAAGGQLALFGEPALPGLSYRRDIVTAAEEAALIAGIEAAGPAPFRFQGWIGKRQTVSFGWHYDFDERDFAPAEPMPEWLLPVRERAAALAGLAPQLLVHALLTRYDPGAGIGWHRDRPVFDHVVGISLGSATTLRFRRRVEAGFERHSIELERRSAYHLCGEARYGWEHGIASVEASRWSITFRTLSERGMRHAASE